MNPGGTMMTGTGVTSVNLRKNGIPVYIRAVSNMKLCVYYLKHTERVQRQPIANTINLVLVRSYCDQQRHEVGFKNTAEEPVINYKDCPQTLENSKEYLASKYGGAGATLDYVVHPDIGVKPEGEDPAEGYETVDQKITAKAPHTGQSFVNARFGTSCPIFLASTIVLYKSSLLWGSGMEGTLICSCLTTSLGPTMWEIWPVQQRPSSLGPFATVKRSVWPGKHMSGSTLNNIQSSMD
jgi:hypothetical protein